MQPKASLFIFGCICLFVTSLPALLMLLYLSEKGFFFLLHILIALDFCCNFVVVVVVACSLFLFLVLVTRCDEEFFLLDFLFSQKNFQDFHSQFETDVCINTPCNFSPVRSAPLHLAAAVQGPEMPSSPQLRSVIPLPALGRNSPVLISQC